MRGVDQISLGHWVKRVFVQPYLWKFRPGFSRPISIPALHMSTIRLQRRQLPRQAWPSRRTARAWRPARTWLWAAAAPPHRHPSLRSLVSSPPNRSSAQWPRPQRHRRQICVRLTPQLLTQNYWITVGTGIAKVIY